MEVFRVGTTAINALLLYFILQHGKKTLYCEQKIYYAITPLTGTKRRQLSLK